MSFTVTRMADYDFLLTDEHDKAFPASFQTRMGAELVCRFLNRMDAQSISACLEPITVKLTPRQTRPPHKSTERVGIKLDGYAKPKDKQLVIATKEPAPVPKDDVKVTL